jgi:hypothetical protein
VTRHRDMLAGCFGGCLLSFDVVKEAIAVFGGSFVVVVLFSQLTCSSRLRANTVGARSMRCSGHSMSLVLVQACVCRARKSSRPLCRERKGRINSVIIKEGLWCR